MNSDPTIIKNFKKRFLFGLIKIEYYIEDRRPDLIEGECDSKYKHFLYLRIFLKKYNWTFRTSDKYEELPYIDFRLDKPKSDYGTFGLRRVIVGFFKREY